MACLIEPVFCDVSKHNCAIWCYDAHVVPQQAAPPELQPGLRQSVDAWPWPHAAKAAHTAWIITADTGAANLVFGAPRCADGVETVAQVFCKLPAPPASRRRGIPHRTEAPGQRHSGNRTPPHQKRSQPNHSTAKRRPVSNLPFAYTKSTVCSSHRCPCHLFLRPHSPALLFLCTCVFSSPQPSSCHTRPS